MRPSGSAAGDADCSEPDAGYTIIELLVSIALFTVVLSVFSAAVVAIQKDLRKQQGVADSADGNRKAFMLLEKQVRYASAINTPGTAADGNYYVEWQSTNSSSQQTCTQWRLAPTTQLLQWRTWVITGGSVTAPSWQTVATGMTNNLTTDAPFQLRPTVVNGVTMSYQRLKVHLISARSKPAGQAVTDVTFTALNTSNAAAPATPVCSQVPRS